jgi:Probable lipoprotein LpqN
MSQIARAWRIFAGGLTAGAIGVTAFAGATASADPLQPAPTPPAPVVAPGVPTLNGVATPGGTTNRFVATPPGSYPAGVPVPAATPGIVGAPAPAATAPTPAVTAPVTGTLREYLQSKGVKLEAQRPQGFRALEITLPVPARWTQVPDPNVPDAFVVIADRQGTSLYTSNAQLVVYKLVGNFDPREAVSHGFVDSQQLMAWQTTNASQADFLGYPSAVIEGTYRQNDMTLNTSRRSIIVPSGPDKYLVALSVTTGLSNAVGDAPATDAIINGFRVAAPGAPAAPVPAQAPAAVPAQAPVQAPAQLPVQAPTQVPAQVPATSPLGLTGQVPAGQVPTAQAPAAQVVTGQPIAAPVAAPAQTLAPTQAAGQQTMPNLLALVPGLPPLPNLNLNLAGAPQR